MRGLTGWSLRGLVVIIGVLAIGATTSQAGEQPVIVDAVPSPEGDLTLLPVVEGEPVAASASGVGVVKILSAPMACTVFFRNQRFEKRKGVLTFDAVPAGTYPIVFEHANRRVTRVAVVQPGQSTVVFGNIDGAPRQASTAEANAADAPMGCPPAAAGETVAAPPGQSIRDADDIYQLAEILRASKNPITRPSRYRRAESLYRKIIQRWPNSDKVEWAYYRLGQIYESFTYRDYEGAIDWYLKVLERNPDTHTYARYRIAYITDKALKDYTQAREWWEQAAQFSKHEGLRERAAKRAAKLAAKGY